MNWVQINIRVNDDFRYMKIHIFALRWRDEIKKILAAKNTTETSSCKLLLGSGHGFKSRTGLKFFSGPIYNYSFQ